MSDERSFVTVSRDLAFPRGLVWAALVDSVLVSGWLDPRVRLVEDSQAVPAPDPASAEDAVLVVDPPAAGLLQARLFPLPGGPLGERTQLELHLEDARVARMWEARLDRLDAMLRGRPTRWGAEC